MRGLDRDRGFTLVEMLCVVGLVLVLIGCFFRYSERYSNKVRYIQAQEELAMLSGAVEYYRTEYGSYPCNEDTSGECFYKILAGDNKNKKNFVDGYDWAVVNDKVLDPWGHPYVYKYKMPSDGKSGSFYVFSVGPNGKSETKDEIKNNKSDDVYRER